MIKISSVKLKELITLLTRAFPRKKVFFENVYVQVSNGELILTWFKKGGYLQVSAACEEADVNEKWQIGVDFKTLKKNVDNLKNLIYLEKNEKFLKISEFNTCIFLPGVSTFWGLVDSDTQNLGFWEARGSFGFAFSDLALLASKYSGKYAAVADFNSVWLDWGDEHIKFVATDGNRMAVLETELKTDFFADFADSNKRLCFSPQWAKFINVLDRFSGISLFRLFKRQEGQIEYEFTSQKNEIKIVIKGPLLKGNGFVNWRDVIPDITESEFFVNAKELNECIKGLETENIIFASSDKSLLLKGRNSECVIPIEYEKKVPFSHVLPLRFLRDVSKGWEKGTELKFALNQSTIPIKITPTGKENVLIVVQPEKA